MGEIRVEAQRQPARCSPACLSPQIPSLRFDGSKLASFQVVFEIMTICALVLIKYFIDFLVSSTSSVSAGVSLFSSLLLLLLGSLFLNHLAYFHYSLLRITLRKALIGLLYGKLLKLPHRSVTSTTAG